MKLAVHLDRNDSTFGYWMCWVCQTKNKMRGRSLFALAKKLGANKSVFDALNKEIPDTSAFTRTSIVDDEPDSVALPDDFIPISAHTTDPERKHAINYLRRRNITPEDIIKYNIGYAHEGDYRYRILIPSYAEDMSLNFFVGRIYDDNVSSMPYKIPSVSKNVVGFEMYINWNYPIVLCEGVFDAIAIRSNAIPLFGKTIPTSVKQKIIDEGVRDVYIALDSDARSDAFYAAQYFYRNGVNVYMVDLDGKDPSSVGFASFRKSMARTNRMSFSDLVTYRLMA